MNHRELGCAFGVWLVWHARFASVTNTPPSPNHTSLPTALPPIPLVIREGNNRAEHYWPETPFPRVF
jgi:hypothetical protein